MFISRNREKLINAIIYFARNTKYCLTTKLFKLLNFLDFEHYRMTGRGVTGLAYKAWQKGPGPADLWRDIQNLPEYLKNAVAFEEIKDELTGEPRGRRIRPLKQFDKSFFTPREMKIMALLAEIFRDARADDMVSVSHGKNYPWEKVFQDGRGKGTIIPYDLALESKEIIGTIPSLPKSEINFRQELHKEIEAETL